MSKSQQNQESYQDLKASLDEVLNKLQADDVDLDVALKLYEQGQETIKKLETYLAKTAHTFEKFKPHP